MSSPSDLIEKAVEGALKDLQCYAPGEYAKLNAVPEQKQKVIDAARQAATLTVDLDKGYPTEPSAQEITTLLAKHLSTDKIKLIEGGLRIQTFRIEIKKNNDQHFLKLIRGGEELMPGRQLVSSEDIEWGKGMQEASILIEVVMFSMSVCGIAANISKEIMKNTAIEIASSSIVRKAVDAFNQAWDSAAGNAYERAKAVFALMTDSEIGSIICNIIKGLFRNMSWFDWFLTCVKVFAMIIAAVSTGGAAIIAEIVLALTSAIEFVQKLSNMNQLSELKKKL